MGLLGPHHHLLLGSIAALTLGVLVRLVILPRSRASAKGTLPGAGAFLAGTGMGPGGAEDTCAAAPMAEARAQAEGADIGAGGKIRHYGAASVTAGRKPTQSRDGLETEGTVRV